jgi:hypothetical protein
VNPLPAIIALVVVWRIATWVRRRRRSSFTSTSVGSLRKRPPRRHWRIGDRRRRRNAADAARILAATIVTGRHDLEAHLAVGVVLQHGELAWQRARADVAIWTTHSAVVTRSRARWSGRRVERTSRHVTASGWQSHGSTDWTITSARLVGRNGDGGLLSIWWSGVVAVQIDLDAETVNIETTTGWRACIAGPGVAPIAVAAVAGCHGAPALLTHPGLSRLRTWSPYSGGVTRQPLLDPLAPREPRALGPGEAPFMLRPRGRSQ